MKKHILVISALLITATACQSKEKPKVAPCQERAAPGTIDEEESCRSISEEFSIEEEQFEAINRKAPEVIVEELLGVPEPIAESIPEEKMEVSDREKTESREQLSASPVILEEASQI